MKIGSSLKPEGWLLLFDTSYMNDCMYNSMLPSLSYRIWSVISQNREIYDNIGYAIKTYNLIIK